VYIIGPRDVAASGTSPLAAVSAWKKGDRGDHLVVVYRGGGTVWECDTGLGVADAGNNRVTMFRVSVGHDGCRFVRHMAEGLRYPWDVEEVEGGWLVACRSLHTVELVGDGVGGGRPSLGKAGGRHGSGDGELTNPTALAVVPGLGLVVRERERLQVFLARGCPRAASPPPLGCSRKTMCGFHSECDESKAKPS
jgi:hypothetical protein